MIRTKRGDILDANTEALVNTVNCVGVMGRGIALQFRKKFPENFRAYKKACDRGEMSLGQIFTFDLHSLCPPGCIINFPTKNHWRAKSRIEYIESGLVALTNEVRQRGIRSIAIPPLGCGLGGLRWPEVRDRIETAFKDFPEVEIQLYEPAGPPPADQMVRNARVPQMTVGRAALLGLVERYLRGFMDPFVTLLEVHKLVYFMQEAGEDLRLRFRKAPFGPYAENLRHVLHLLEGHFINGYADGADAPAKQIELLDATAAQAHRFLREHPETQARFDRVSDLVEGFETPLGMELLATVQWVATHEGATTPDEAISLTHAWDARKTVFEPDHIRIAWEVLESKGWLARESDEPA